MGTGRFKGALLAALVIASLITPLLLLSPSPVHAALTPHAPILINGNGGFTSPDPVNGGGSGTENDPYIIENYIIDASTASGIEVRNTTDYFVVRNSVIENGENFYFGIYLYNVVNGRVENCISRNNHTGIHLSNSSNNTLDNNTCDNNFSYFGNSGISLSWYSDYNTLTNNTCSNNSRGGINLLSSSNYNTLYNNTSKNNSIGINLFSSSNNTLDSNACKNNATSGIHLLNSSDNNTLTNNTCENNDYDGIFLYTSDYNTLTNNTYENNSSYGINLFSSSNNTLDSNACKNNATSGIHLLNSSDNNSIYHNNFINNMNQAYDNGSNYWDDGYPSGGNYWSDYAGSDANGDGIGDTPYSVPGDNNQDRYPLMNPWSTPYLGTAAFSLVDLYTVNVEKILDLNQGSKLVVKFYTYGDAFENENVIENFSPPWHVEENESARHPEGIGVKKARLVLTTDDTENVISTVASFVVTKVTLEIRFSEVPLEWALASPAGRVALEIEFSQIPLYWALAPS